MEFWACWLGCNYNIEYTSTVYRVGKTYIYTLLFFKKSLVEGWWSTSTTHSQLIRHRYLLYWNPFFFVNLQLKIARGLKCQQKFWSLTILREFFLKIITSTPSYLCSILSASHELFKYANFYYLLIFCSYNDHLMYVPERHIPKK